VLIAAESMVSATVKGTLLAGINAYHCQAGCSDWSSSC
jgi:hypothetical protein